MTPRLKSKCAGSIPSMIAHAGSPFPGEVIGFASAGFRRPGTADAAEHAPFLFAGGEVRSEARRRGVGSLLLGEIHSLMHTLDKSVLTLATHTKSGYAFLAKVGATAKLTTVSSRANF